jgi:transcription elongation GreA/GreB family factor
VTNSLHQSAKSGYITAAGLANLRQQLAAIKQIRAALIKEMHELTLQSGAGSTLEDSGQVLQQHRTMELEAQISDIEYTIRTAQVIDQPASNSEVQIGSQVTIEVARTQHTYTICAGQSV